MDKLILPTIATVATFGLASCCCGESVKTMVADMDFAQRATNVEVGATTTASVDAKLGAGELAGKAWKVTIVSAKVDVPDLFEVTTKGRTVLLKALKPGKTELNVELDIEGDRTTRKETLHAVAPKDIDYDFILHGEGECDLAGKGPLLMAVNVYDVSVEGWSDRLDSKVVINTDTVWNQEKSSPIGEAHLRGRAGHRQRDFSFEAEGKRVKLITRNGKKLSMPVAKVLTDFKVESVGISEHAKAIVTVTPRVNKRVPCLNLGTDKINPGRLTVDLKGPCRMTKAVGGAVPRLIFDVRPEKREEGATCDLTLFFSNMPALSRSV